MVFWCDNYYTMHNDTHSVHKRGLVFWRACLLSLDASRYVYPPPPSDANCPPFLLPGGPGPPAPKIAPISPGSTHTPSVPFVTIRSSGISVKETCRLVPLLIPISRWTVRLSHLRSNINFVKIFNFEARAASFCKFCIVYIRIPNLSILLTYSANMHISFWALWGRIVSKYTRRFISVHVLQESSMLCSIQTFGEHERLFLLSVNTHCFIPRTRIRFIPCTQQIRILGKTWVQFHKLRE
jgi:hypothetical protein